MICTCRPHCTTHPKHPLVPTCMVSAMVLPLMLSTSSNSPAMKYLLGMLERLPSHVVIVATTTSVTWANEIDGLYSRWARFRFAKPPAKAIAAHCERIARTEGLPVPDGFNWLRYVQDLTGNNIRDCIDQLPAALRKRSAAA